MSEVLAPAIEYAYDGFPVSGMIAEMWRRHAERLRAHPSGLELLGPSGDAPRHGESIRLRELGASLEQVSRDGADSFYSGEIATKITTLTQQHGGLLEAADLATFVADWERPISVKYRDIQVFQCGPNSQGVSALLALRLLDEFGSSLADMPKSDRIHVIVQAMREGLKASLTYVGDPRFVDVPVERLLSDEHVEKSLAEMYLDNASSDVMGEANHNPGDTTYIGVVDGNGMACSLIASLYEAFGSGLVVPGTGIALHNRGLGFSLESGHPSEMLRGRRPYHTLMPAIALKGDGLYACFGAVGGFHQPQAQVQALSNVLDLGLDPQQALDEPRVGVNVQTGELLVEPGLEVAAERLRERGHKVRLVSGFMRQSVGAGQFIMQSEGALVCGSDPRMDGAAMVW